MLYDLTMGFLKLAILFQLLHIFAPIRTSGLNRAIRIIMVALVLFYLTCFMLRVLACIPRKKIWDPFTPGTCINSSAVILSSAVFNSISDFLVLFLPIRSVWQLQIPTRKKWGISTVFATGAL